MKKSSIIILGLAALTLSGCKSLYGKYERPDIKASGLYRDSVSNVDTLAVKDTTTFANLPWRSVFTDPQLQSLIETGLKNNPNLLNAALNMDIAQAQLKAHGMATKPRRSIACLSMPVGTRISGETCSPRSGPLRCLFSRPRITRCLCRVP